MKKLLLLFFALFSICSVCKAEQIELEMRENCENTEQRPRSVSPEVTASIDGVTITLNLSVFADCEYSVTDSSTEAVICSGRFRAGATTVFNMPNSTPAGTYRLSVYAYGCWWTGTFVY